MIVILQIPLNVMKNQGKVISGKDMIAGDGKIY